HLPERASGSVGSDRSPCVGLLPPQVCRSTRPEKCTFCDRGCQPMNSVDPPAAGAGLVAGPADLSVPVGASGVPVPAGTVDPLSGPGTSLAAKETVPGNSTGLPKSTCQVNASGRP